MYQVLLYSIFRDIGIRLNIQSDVGVHNEGETNPIYFLLNPNYLPKPVTCCLYLYSLVINSNREDMSYLRK